MNESNQGTAQHLPDGIAASVQSLRKEGKISTKCDMEESRHEPIVIRAGSSLSNDHTGHSNFRMWDACSLDVEPSGTRGGPGKRSGGQF